MKSIVHRALASLFVAVIAVGCSNSPKTEGSSGDQAVEVSVVDPGVSYTLFDEVLQDTPVKTQIEQHVVASGVPSASGLATELRRRYNEALSRNGFQHHNPATNVYVYVYATEEQAGAGKGLWLGMIGKGYDDDSGQLEISDERLDALSQPVSDTSRDLDESTRRQVFREIAAAEARATREAQSKIPDSEILKQIALEGELETKYKKEIATRYELTDEGMRDIVVEGVRAGWVY